MSIYFLHTTLLEYPPLHRAQAEFGASPCGFTILSSNKDKIYSFHGVVVSTPRYEFAGLNSNPGPGSRRSSHPVVHLPVRADRYMGIWVNLGKVNYGNSDVGFAVSLGYMFSSTTG